MNELSKQYNPHQTEDKWYKLWEEKGFFRAQANPEKKPFCIVIPPPNVTGILHMGHALNNTIQDILIRYHRMKGEESLWMPGTDHAGIATQNVVEKSIAKEGLKRQDLGREKFIERVWQWKEEYGSTITRQLKKLGASCDWSRTRFTMDEEYSKAVRYAFVYLWKKNLIYQGDKVINWCPRCQTALSDEEAPHHELEGKLYYIKYPLVVSRSSLAISKPKTKNKTKEISYEYIVVATTRPETMLGDTAVAVNPKDKRYKHIIGKSIELPLIGREIKIIADSSVDMKFGTGAVKVTPAHDPNDYALGKKHGLEFINIMYPDARMNELAGDYKDMDRFEAREVIIEDLRQKGLLDKIEPHNLSAGHCYRCRTIIEPYLSKQWFIKMETLAKPAIEAVKKGKIKFYPKRWAKVYLNWMENIQDWCISRQIWWGHRIPVYYCRSCQTSNSHCEEAEGRRSNLKKRDCFAPSGLAMTELGVIVSRSKPDKCPDCGSTDIFQDEDVLDTWFSSWLWPFATFGWPFETHNAQPFGFAQGRRTTHNESDLNYFYPTSVLVTAPEIIFFWVARMIMAGYEFMGELPFRDVYIHGTVRDVEGKKMSKSLGNIIDPLEIINEYGTDALRFSLISITAQGQDVYLSKERFEQGRNFCNKVWNASRFILMNLDKEKIKTDLCQFFKQEKLSLVNRWILSKFYSLLKEMEKQLNAFKFNEAANALYAFFWHEFCDWYLELIKQDIRKDENQVVMYKVLEKFLRMAHPFMPFISEEIWQKLPHDGESIMTQSWPHLQEQIIDKRAEKEMSLVFALINTIRNMRSELEIPLQDPIPARVSVSAKAKKALFESMEQPIKTLSRLSSFILEERYSHQPGNYVAVLEDMHIVIPLSGVIDIEKYRASLEQKIKKAEGDIKAKSGLLSNANFVKKAPSDVVEAEKAKLNELKQALEKLKGVRDGLR